MAMIIDHEAVKHELMEMMHAETVASAEDLIKLAMADYEKKLRETVTKTAMIILNRDFDIMRQGEIIRIETRDRRAV